MHTKENILDVREFLNKSGYHSTANIVTVINKESYSKEVPYYRGTYSIADCGRPIDLAIDLSSEEDCENTVYKLNKIIEATIKMRDAVIKHTPEIIKLAKIAEAKESLKE